MCVSNLAEKNAATRLKFVFFNYNICTHINNCLSEIERKGKETAKKLDLGDFSSALLYKEFLNFKATSDISL